MLLFYLIKWYNYIKDRKERLIMKIIRNEDLLIETQMKFSDVSFSACDTYVCDDSCYDSNPTDCGDSYCDDAYL